MYYDPNKTMSRQRLFNFVIGARGCGKTYGAKRMAIRSFLRTGKQFVYIRRYETELPSAEMRNFFDDIQNEFPGVEFLSGRGLFRINNDVAGWYIALSKAVMLKSVPFPNVGLIIFDEFIIEVGMHRYLPNEVRTFLECYSTISRDRDVPVLFLSNAITISNPYFLYFNLKFEKGQTVKLLKHISLELIQSEEYSEHVKQTRFGELISGTSYGSYNIENQFLLDDEEFVEKLPPGCMYQCTVILNGRKYGYYMGKGTNYISDNVDNNSEYVFTLNIEDHTAETFLVQSYNPYIKSIVAMYCNGTLRFTSVEVKNAVTEVLRKLI